VISRDACVAKDLADSLAALRHEFYLDEGEIYLDGNSLGPLSQSSKRRIAEVVDHEWGQGLVRSWNLAGWMDMPIRLGDRLASLIGARPGEVLVADTLTFAIAKLLGTALDQRPDRSVVLTDRANFHSDIYIIEEVARRHQRNIEVRCIDRNDLDKHLGPDVAVVEFTQVDFRTGEQLDVKGITEKVHAAGALVIWDFAHSAGAVPLDVTGDNVDFAAGCSYKYLNAGPGGPAFMYVRREWQDKVSNPLPGWLGHARPFDFELDYESAQGMRKFVTSSPSIIALASLDGSLDVWDKAPMDQVRKKSLGLTDLFIDLVEERLPGEFRVVTPREHAKRGSQVALAHPEAYGVVQALIERRVIGDFREPDICRFGFTPLYLRYADVYDAVERLVDVIQTKAHLDAKFQTRNPVT
jgi:kynureninase